MSNIVLKSIGDNKVQVIKVLREITNLDLKETKDIVDGVEAGNEYVITDVQETDIQSFIQKFTQIGAVVKVNEDVKRSDSVKICKQCGVELREGAKFCGSCGAAVDVENIITEEEQESSEKEQESSEKEQEDLEKEQEDLSKESKNNKISKAIDFFIEWHKACMEKNRILTIILIIAEIVVVLWLLFSAWETLLCILIIASIVLPFIMKHDFTDKDRQNSKEILIGFAKIMVGIIIILVIVFNWKSISNIFRPGAVVRDAYLVNYSDEITVGEAFENVFTDCKWSTYSYNGNEYVQFTGNFIDDDGEEGYHQITFLIIGDSATIDSWQINGIDVSWAETLMLVSIYKRNGVSW